MCEYDFRSEIKKEYRLKMMDELVKDVPALRSVMDAKTESCISNKAKCQFYEHFCGKNKVWNFQNLLRYIQFHFQDIPHPIAKSLLIGTSFLLQGKNSEIFLSSVSNFCPNISTHCGPTGKRKREVPKDLENFFESDKVHSRKKRIFDPREIMRLFNKVVCDNEIVEILADYWDLHRKRIYSYVPIVEGASEIWCCIVHDLEKSY